MKQLRRVLLLTCMLLCLASAHAKQRVALVIGNSAYKHETPLRNPVNDARLMAKTLKAAPLKFDQVIEVYDASRGDLLAAIDRFRPLAERADFAVVYYSGHGMINSKRVNHLLPVEMPRLAANASLSADTALKTHGVTEDDLIEAIEGARVQVVVLDACRDNGFDPARKSTSKGLAPRQETARNRLLAYATELGRFAEDGIGANSTYAQSLAKHLGRTDWSVLRVFDEVASDVEKATGGTQLPTRTGNLRTDVYLLASVKPGPDPDPKPDRQPLTPDAEKEAWELTKRRDTAAGYRAYLNEYPLGRFASGARVALEGLQPAPQPVQPQAISSTQPSQAFRDCQEAHCPEMMVIPAGNFTMGSNDADADADEKPTRQVSIRSFAMGKFEVTQGQWKAVMGSNPSKFSNCGDNCPVDQVSWNDIQRYIQKLNQKTGKQYRLPSEAEWEYAARAGNPGRWSFGDNEGALGQHAWYSANSNQQMKPVGQKLANAFGLHDMHGNVMEWVQDCHEDNYAQGQPTDGRAHRGSDSRCKHRAVRSGTAYYIPSGVTSAYRYWNPPGERYDAWGFRLTRTVP